MSTEEPKVPMLEKMKAVKEQSQQIGAFLDWLINDQHLCIAKMDRYGQVDVVHDTIEGLLAKYFEIDLEQAEQEKLALLDYIRKENQCGS